MTRRLLPWALGLALLLTGFAPARELTEEDARRVAELATQVLSARRAGRLDEARAALQASLAIRRRAQPAGHWEIRDDEQRLRTVERTAALPAAAQAELAEVKRLDGTLHRLFYQEGKVAEALRLQEKALGVYRQHLGEDDLEVIAAAYNLARLCLAAGRAEDAEQAAGGAARAALRVLGEAHPLTARCHDALATALTARGRSPEAAPLFEKGLAIARAALGDDALETAVFYNSAGSGRNALADYAGAAELYEKALAIRRRRLGENHPLTAQSYNNVAANLAHRGRYAEAEPLLRQALAIRRDALGPDHPETARAACNLAMNLAILGHVAEAEALVRQALEVFRKKGGAVEAEAARWEAKLANLLADQGRFAEAEAHARHALEGCRARLGDDHPVTANAYQALGIRLVDLGRHAEAETHLRKALAIYRDRLGADHPEAVAALCAVAAVLHARKEFAAAEPLLREALAARRTRLGDRHPETARAHFNLAMSLGAQGRYAEAEPVARQAVDRCQEALGEAHPLTARAHAGLARILGALGRYAEAAAAGRAAARGFEAARLRVSFAGLGRVPFAEESPLPGLVACLARAGHGAEAWQYWEANLARGLLDEVAARDARPLTAEDRGREQALLDRLGQLDRRILEPDAAGAPGAALRRERDAAQAEFARLQGEWAERYGVAAGQVYDLARIQRQIPADAALVGWLDLPPQPGAADPTGDYWACVLRRTGPPAWVRLAGTGPAGRWTREDRDLVDQTRGALAQPPDGAAVPADLARRLYAQRLGALEGPLGAPGDLPPARRLIVLSSGWTANVPVEAVTDRYAVSYAPSATLFAWLREKPPAAPTEGGNALLAVGDPDFADTGFAALPGTRREVDAVANLFTRADRLLGPDASERRLGDLAAADRLRAYRYVHLASHAQIDPERPLRSAVILAGGRLTAADVLHRWKLDAELVALSACESGLGRYTPGEGHLGFAQAFLLAGARSLVVSLWKVDDAAAVLLMRRFYENLLGARPDLPRPLGKAAALREARDWLRRLTAEEVRQRTEGLRGGGRGSERRRNPGTAPEPTHPFAHPYYWSAFVLIGDAE